MHKFGTFNLHTLFYTIEGNPYGLSTSDSIVDPHMMKNSEWGAVAYLSQNTTYGKGSEVWINNNTSFITGRAGDSVSEESSENTGEYAYYTRNGQQASTTGNTTGVYDMSGGAWETVAAYVNNSYVQTTGSCYEYGSTLIETDGRYKDIYGVGVSDSRENNYEASTPAKSKYGDAIYETSSSGISPYTNSWYNDYAHFPCVSNPFLFRGGSYDSNSIAGVSAFRSRNGSADSAHCFRVVLPVL